MGQIDTGVVPEGRVEVESESIADLQALAGGIRKFANLLLEWEIIEIKAECI
jgi:hypothetical protein